MDTRVKPAYDESQIAPVGIILPREDPAPYLFGPGVPRRQNQTSSKMRPITVRTISIHQPVRSMSWRRRTDTAKPGKNSASEARLCKRPSVEIGEERRVENGRDGADRESQTRSSTSIPIAPRARRRSRSSGIRTQSPAGNSCPAPVLRNYDLTLRVALCAPVAFPVGAPCGGVILSWVAAA